MKKILVAAAAALSILTPGCSNINQYIETEAQCKKEDALEDLVRSVVCIRNTTTYVSQDGAKREEVQAYGTGFAYKKEEGWTYVTTNHHVGNLPDRRIVIDFFDPENNMTWQKEKSVLTIVDNRADERRDDDIFLEALRSNQLLDTMVLRTTAPLHIAHSYRIAHHQQVDWGDQVYVAGFPLGFIRAVTEGVVANPVLPADSLEYIFLDMTIQPGHSGSPVFLRDTDGEFYLIGQIRKCMPYTGMCGGFGMATNISELNDVWRIGAPEPLPFFNSGHNL